MAAIDVCEPQIIRALEKDGWVISEKPAPLYADTHSLLADLLCERQIDGITERIVVVEVKCFINPKNDLVELYSAIGQYVIYRAAISASGDETPVYLGIPDDAFERLISDRIFGLAFEQVQMRFVVVSLVDEVIVSWNH